MKTPEELAEEFSDAFAGERRKTIAYKAFWNGYQAAAPNWISIHDEIPQTHDDVLWCNPHSGIMIVSSGNPKFDGNLNEQYFTHWMPLPEPPEEKK